MKKYLLIFIGITITSCAPKITTSISKSYTKIADDSPIDVYDNSNRAPQNAILIGKTKIGDTGFTTNCTFETVIDLAKQEARKNGANALAITEHLFPNILGSSCHRISVDLLKIDKTNENVAVNNESKDTIVAATNNNMVVSYQKIVNKSEKSKFLIIGNLAQSFRVASTADGLSPAVKEYVNDLKSGISYDFSAYYLKDATGGFGLKYNVFNSKGSIKNQTVRLSDGSQIFGTATDNITIQFIGASFIYSENENARTGEALIELSLGYMSYNNDASFAGVPLKITGGNLGISAAFGYHFRINKNILIGPTINFLGGNLRELKYTYADGTSETIKLEKEQFENLWRIDLALGLKFRL